MNNIPEERRVDHDLDGVQVIEIAPDDQRLKTLKILATTTNRACLDCR